MHDITDRLGDLVERFDHVAMGVHDIRGALPFVDLLGGAFLQGGHNRSGGFRWAQFSLPGNGKLELISPFEPHDDDHFLVRFLSRRGEGVHHMTFKVRRLDEAVARAREIGFEVTGHSDAYPNWSEAFVHPKSAHGVVIQLAEFQDDGNSFGSTDIEDVLGEPSWKP